MNNLAGCWRHLLLHMLYLKSLPVWLGTVSDQEKCLSGSLFGGHYSPPSRDLSMVLSPLSSYDSCLAWANRALIQIAYWWYPDGFLCMKPGRDYRGLVSDHNWVPLWLR